MSFYIYQLVEPIILSNTSTNLSIICHHPSAINYLSSVMNYQPAYQLSAGFSKHSLNKVDVGSQDFSFVHPFSQDPVYKVSLVMEA